MVGDSRSWQTSAFETVPTEDVFIILRTGRRMEKNQ
jgi:hypothetical protein